MTTKSYSLGSWGVLESEIDFPELSAVEGVCADFTFVVENTARSEYGSDDLIQQWELPGGDEWLSLYRHAGGYAFDFPNYACFFVSKDYRSVKCRPREGLEAATMRHLILDQVLPLLMSGRGELILHASAVAINGRAVVFVGESGAGKSTIAVKLASRGYPLLTDDCLLLRDEGDGYLAYPSYAGARLFGPIMRSVLGEVAVVSEVAQYTSKQRLDLSATGIRMQENAIPLGSVFILAKSNNTLAVQPVEGSHRFVELAKYVYRLDPNDQEKLRSEVPRIAALVAMPCFRLLYPQTAESLDDVVHTVVSVVSADQ